MSLESKIRSLIAGANAKTGETDADLTNAIQRLIDGYGSGGGGNPTLSATLRDGSVVASSLWSTVRVDGASAKSIEIDNQTVWSEQTGLPNGYTLLSYIKSTVTQYIDTGIKVQCPSAQSVEQIITVRGIATGIQHYSGGNYNAFWGISGAGTYTVLDVSNVPVGNIDVVTVKTNGGTCQLFVNDTYVISYTDTRTVYDIAVGISRIGNPGGGFVGDPMSAEWYKYQIIIDGVSVRDYVPCINDRNQVGLYDLVTQVFYGNAGTGEFIAGYEDA